MQCDGLKFHRNRRFSTIFPLNCNARYGDLNPNLTSNLQLYVHFLTYLSSKISLREALAVSHLIPNSEKSQNEFQKHVTNVIN